MGGLGSGSKRPDGIVQVDGKVTDVFFYHGNFWHGYPPEHEFYDIEIAFPRAAADGHRHVVNTKELYNKTMNEMQLFKAQGHTVYYMWEHEHIRAKRSKAPLRSVLRVL